METSLKYIAFFDILGFKDLVEKNSHSVLNSIYEELFEGASNDVIARWANVISQYDFADNRIDIAIISDSIILYSKDTTQKSFTQLFFFSRKLLQNAFYSGIPLRGAITIGEITARNTSTGSFTIFGKGLVDAYLLEESQNWSGCLIAPNAITHLDKSCQENDNAGSQQFEAMKFIVRCNLELKNKTSQEYFVINWTRYLRPDFSEKNIEISFTQFNKTVNSKVQLIIDNTIKFYSENKNSS